MGRTTVTARLKGFPSDQKKPPPPLFMVSIQFSTQPHTDEGMGVAASCLAAPSPPSAPASATIAYEAPAPPQSKQQLNVQLAFAYASRPGTSHAESSFSCSTAFAAKRQPLKQNQDVVVIRPSYGGLPFLHLFGVFDGHGAHGAAASHFARDRMEALLLQELRGRSGGSLERVAGLSTEAVVAACKAAFLGVERALGLSLEVDDSFSGTTAVIVLLIGCRLFAASVGDSRAVLGLRKGEESRAVAVDALTWDHTPCRADELARVKRAGGVVMSYEQMSSPQGAARPSWHTQVHQKQDAAAADALPSLDPPRVWDRSVTKPGCCFTRSLGDSFAKTLGVIADPEVTVRELEGASTLCLGSDGVFEFLTNKELLAIVTAHLERPLAACRAVCARSALLLPSAGKQETQEQRERRELLYHHRDDTTLICIHIQTQKNDQQK